MFGLALAVGKFGDEWRGVRSQTCAVVAHVDMGTRKERRTFVV